ncbi:MAG: sulfatase-like hydrolase/transferase [Planctomycetota bacterium]
MIGSAESGRRATTATFLGWVHLGSALRGHVLWRRVVWRRVLWIALLWLEAPLLACNGNGDGERPPSFLFILADDLGWGDLPSYGNPVVEAPRLDRLASEGTLFTNFYVNGPVCSPTRCAFLTGRFPGELRVHGHFGTPEQNRDRGMPDWLDPAVPTITKLLRDSGYATGHIGKWHLSSKLPEAPAPDAYGFTRWRLADQWDEGVSLWNLKERPTSTRRIVDEAIRFIEDAGEQPFYLQVWLLDVHAILNPSDEQMQAYADLAVPGIPYRGAAQVYYSVITDADAHIGRLLDRLDALGRAADTIVVLSSDNGPEIARIKEAGHSAAGSAGPFRGHKRSLYEGGIRVPFIVRWPGHIPAGVVEDTSVVSGIDMLPTFAALAGIPVPAEIELDGEDVSDILLGTPRARSSLLLWEYRFEVLGHPLNRSPSLAIREGPWKLLLNPNRSRLELYNLIENPGESEDVASIHPQLVQRLAETLVSWSKTLPHGPLSPEAGRNDYPWPGK